MEDQWGKGGVEIVKGDKLQGQGQVLWRSQVGDYQSGEVVEEVPGQDGDGRGHIHVLQGELCRLVSKIDGLKERSEGA